MGKLTPKQKRFVEEYLIDLNATQAAIRAGYSPNSAACIGRENLDKTDIKNEVEKALAERSKRTGINADRIVTELAKIAFVNPVDVINMKDASLLDNYNLDDTAAISSVKVKSNDDGQVIEREIKTYDKIKALELLGKHIGMFSDKFKVDGVVPIVIKEDLLD